MSSGKCKFGIVGAGAIAQTYAQVLKQCELVEMAGVADTRPEAAAAMAEVLGCRPFPNHLAMAEQSGAEAVLVATPPSTHAAITMDLLRTGIHVICEKPFTIDHQSALAMIGAARESGAILTMASKFRYVDDVIRARGIITSGILGEILSFENSFTGKVDMSKRWNSNPGLSGGGVLIDNGTHSLDIMRYLLGPVEEVQVIEGKRASGLPVEETVHILARVRDGALGHIDLSWSMNKDLGYYIKVYGSLGTVWVGWKDSKFKQATGRDWVVFGTGYDKFQALGSQIRNFVRAVRKEEVLLITTDDALASVDAVEAAYSSLRRNAWVAVNGHQAVGVG